MDEGNITQHKPASVHHICSGVGAIEVKCEMLLPLAVTCSLLLAVMLVSRQKCMVLSCRGQAAWQEFLGLNQF